MAEHNQLGKQGEEIAREYLAKKGYRIIETNWRYGKSDEIDIIAEDGGTLVFVEVKTRSSNEYGEPEDFVTRKKQRFLIRAANFYIESKDVDIESRFDVVAIIIDSEKENIKHIEEAFSPWI